MKALDTNILVRFLTGDDDFQSEKVYHLFKQCEEEKIELFIPLLVVIEVIWVLESVYSISRNSIVDSIENLILMPIFQFEQHIVLQKFILSARKGKYDLADLLIAYSANFSGCESVLTFDKNAAKSDLFELMK